MSACKVRPLSQIGLIRIPSNAKARQFIDGLPAERKALDAINERLAEDDWRLHPTKGRRRLTPRLTMLAMLTEQLRHGRHLSTAQLRAALKDARAVL